jgi:hypothetical protein
MFRELAPLPSSDNRLTLGLYCITSSENASDSGQYPTYCCCNESTTVKLVYSVLKYSQVISRKYTVDLIYINN